MSSMKGSPESASAFYRAKRAGRCKFCGRDILKGNPLFPVQLSSAGQLSTLTMPLPTSPLQAALPQQQPRPRPSAGPAHNTDCAQADGSNKTDKATGPTPAAPTTPTTPTTPAQAWRDMAASAARVEWVHASCAMRLQGLLPSTITPCEDVQALPRGAEKLRRPPCKHWLRPPGGRCVFGAKCFFAHDLDALAALQARQPTVTLSSGANGCASAGTGANANTDAGAASSRGHLLAIPRSKSNAARKVQNRGVGRRTHVRNDARASVFRRWLLAKFGRDYLCSGAGILDVAGGKGELGFELLNLNGIESTVVDPRPLDLRSCSRKLELGMYHRNAVLSEMGVHVHRDMAQVRREGGARAPQHLRLFFRASLANSVGGDGGGGGGGDRGGTWNKFLNQWSFQMDPGSTDRGVQHGEQQQQQQQQQQHMSGDSAVEQALHEALEQARAVKWTSRGLHDQDEDDEGGEAGAETSADMGAIAGVGAVEGTEEAEGEDECARARTKEGGGEPQGCGEAWLAEAQQLLGGESAGVEDAEEENDDDDEDAMSALRPGRAAASPPQASELSKLDQVERVLHTCSAVIGMHPDQAAGAIAEFALASSPPKPFAIVPCCVYGKTGEFARRKTRDGRPVRSYDDLVRWLAEKHPLAQVEKLDFEGKNKVVFLLPQDVDRSVRAGAN